MNVTKGEKASTAMSIASGIIATPKNPVMKVRKQSPPENVKIHYHPGSCRRVKCIRIIIRHAASRPEEEIPTRVREIGSIKKKGAINGATRAEGREGRFARRTVGRYEVAVSERAGVANRVV